MKVVLVTLLALALALLVSTQDAAGKGGLLSSSPSTTARPTKSEIPSWGFTHHSLPSRVNSPPSTTSAPPSRKAREATDSQEDGDDLLQHHVPRLVSSPPSATATSSATTPKIQTAHSHESHDSD